MTMMLLPVGVAATAVALIALCLAQRPRTRLHWTLSAGLALLAAEAGAVYVLLAFTESYDDRVFWLGLVQSAGVVLPLPWLLFSAALVDLRPLRTRVGWGAAVGVTTTVAAG